MRVLLVFLLLGMAASAAAEPGGDPRPEPLIFQADRIEFDRERNLVAATGDVELAREGRILRADRIVLDRNTGIARAHGNVTLIQPDGEVMFADSVELGEDLKDGFVEQFRARLGSSSRLAASSGQLQGGTQADLNRAVYSACEPCADNPTAAPTWQVKARRVTHDRVEQKVTYRDAVLEMWGVPVLYTPYLSHPDPDVDRKSGFLTPSVGLDSDLGARIETPWFWNIAPNRDATLIPVVASDRGFVGAGEYRHLFDRGHLELSGSLASLDKEPAERAGSGPRGHIRLKGEVDATTAWRFRGEFYRTSDDGYLDLVDFDGADTLPSFAEAEGFFDHSYARVGVFDAQELREGVSGDKSPLAAPELFYEWRGEPSPDGAWSLRAAGAALHRRRDDENQRVMLEGGWRLERFTDGGHRLEVGAGLRGDVAHGDLVRGDGNADDNNARLLPQATAGWSYLLAGGMQDMQVTIEPRAQLVLGRNSADSDEFPMEDSRAVEFEFANLFAVNRFPGLDGVETGQRIDYGFQASLHGSGDWHVDAGLGQSRRRKANQDAPVGSGLDTAVSDIVGKVDLTAGQMTALGYRFRLDKDDLTARQTALDLSLDLNPLQFDARYARAVGVSDPDPNTAGGEREQVDLTLRATMDMHWSAFGRYRRNLDTGRSMLGGVGLKYEDECVLFETAFEREYKMTGGDVDNRVSVRLVFRDLSGSFAKRDLRPAAGQAQTTPSARSASTSASE
ncbi:MAG: LPS assembly protein LptD [Alphaproteobacteria bacterium]|nr:LPS assembly protein LptD [Alphaproteobacteria bacterium]